MTDRRAFEKGDRVLDIYGYPGTVEDVYESGVLVRYDWQTLASMPKVVPPTELTRLA